MLVLASQQKTIDNQGIGCLQNTFCTDTSGGTLSSPQLKTPIVPQGNVLDFPSYIAFGRQVDRGEEVRFTLTLGEFEQEVQVLESTARSNVDGIEKWWGIVCPIDTLDTGQGARAIRVLRENDTVTYI